MALPSPPDYGARIVETHISILFFVGDRVYKSRKPVKYGFLDFTERAEREADCQREVELNSRYAPDVYLGVLDVCSEGAPVDHVVVMKQLPDARRLSALIGTTRARDAVRGVARLLVEIEQYSLRSAAIDATATTEAIRAAWLANFAEVEPFVGPVLDAASEAHLRQLVDRFLAGRIRLFESRIAAGKIRDGHGDLEAEDIFCLDDGPRILDCIEFDELLRYGDVVADLAFLAMDLERLGGAALAEDLLTDFEELSGEALPRRLTYHYCASRSYVRAKVACLAHAEGAPGAADEARRLQALTVSFLDRARMHLVVVGGPPGTGKSTLASGIGDALGMVVLRSDEIRKELSGAVRGPAAEGPAEPDALYAPATTALTYSTMMERARLALELGQPVVLDASWTSEALRAEARALALATSSDLFEIRCEAPLATAVKRVAGRGLQGGDPSDATADVAIRLAEAADAWPSAHVVDTSGTEGQSLETALAMLP